MPTLFVRHEGGMSSSLNVRGHKIIADVPPEMGGDDRGPTPVDLLAGSLGVPASPSTSPAGARKRRLRATCSR
jgi:uncharacterized OsmC-like protein